MIPDETTYSLAIEKTEKKEELLDKSRIDDSGEKSYIYYSSPCNKEEAINQGAFIGDNV